MKNKEVTLSDRIQYLSFSFLSRLITLVPHGLALWIALLISRFSYTLFPFRKKTIRENLKTAFKSAMSESEIKRLTKEAYNNLAMLTVDSIFAQQRGSEWAHSRVVESEGVEKIRSLEKKFGNFISVSGHFGSWELMGSCANQLTSLEVAPVSKPLHNPILQQKLEEIRGNHGLKTIWTHESSVTRQILKALKSGTVVNFLADQDMKMEGIFVPFFGKLASTSAGPAFFSLRLSLPILPVFLVRLGPTRHRFICMEPIDPAKAEGENADEKIWWITNEYTKAIQEMATLYPAQYFWFHKRWKTTLRAYEKRKQTLENRRRNRLQSDKGST